MAPAPRTSQRQVGTPVHPLGIESGGHFWRASSAVRLQYTPLVLSAAVTPPSAESQKHFPWTVKPRAGPQAASSADASAAAAKNS
jgi:hypothetical protein